MLCKSLKHSSRFSIKFFSSVALAGVALGSVGTTGARAASSVTPVAPYGLVTPSLGGSATVFYAPSGIAGLNVDSGDTVTDPGTGMTSQFRQITVTDRIDASNLVQFNVNTTKPFISINAGLKSGGTAFVPLYDVNNFPCQDRLSDACTGILVNRVPSTVAEGYQFAPVLVPTSGGTVEVGFFLQNLCTLNADIKGCLGTTPGTVDVSSTAQPFTFTFNFSDTAAVGGTPETATLNLQLETTLPTLSACSPDTLDSLYFPGDERIYLNTDKLGGTTQSGANAIIVVGQNNAPPNTSSIIVNQLHPRVPVGGSREVTGFANTDGTGGNSYHLAFALRDNAGAYSAFGCPLTHVQTSQISTFLQKSSCFIATAAFRSGEDAPVLMLRQFRDRVLLQHDFGQLFVRWYYGWSPPAAEWLMEHPAFRFPVLTALIPVQLFGWLALHLGAAALLLSLTLLAWIIAFLPATFIRRGAFTLLAGTTLIGFAALSTRSSQAQEASNSPYIDSLQKKIEEEDAKKSDTIKNEPARTQENPDPYIQKLRQGMNPAPPANQESYTEALQRKLNEKPTPQGSFIEQEKPKITHTPGDGSAIDDFHAGKTLEPKMEPLTHQAFGIQFDVTSDHNATNDTAAAPYKTVYGSNFVPDLKFFYEFKPFDREWIGSLGVILNLGFTFKNGQGPFKFPLTKESGVLFDALSQTKLQFFTIPLTAGLIYRANLSRYIKPYVEFGPAIIGYVETRNDNGPWHYGESRGYYGEAGVNFLLDWISRGAAWDLYDANGIKHYYLTVNYARLSTFSGAVGIMATGFNAGFTFEL
ncbi:MAG: hypothetical protein H7222_10360 [Methylotenera sp.]|nr:hypothetical protein [Oligoflexia bacterium]